MKALSYNYNKDVKVEEIDAYRDVNQGQPRRDTALTGGRE